MPEEAHTSRMRAELLRNLGLHFFDDEADAILVEIDSLSAGMRQKALALCLSLSSVSPSLVPRVLGAIGNVLMRLPSDSAERWIGQAFDLFDSRGLDAVLGFISHTDQTSLAEFETPKGLGFSEWAARLEIYLRGISGLDIRVAEAPESYTDTSTVYLPGLIDGALEPRAGLTLCKFMAAHKWAQIAGGTLTADFARYMPPQEPAHPDIEDFFKGFKEMALAVDIYNILEAIRLDAFLERELPGLMREMREARAGICRARPEPGGMKSQKAAFVEGLYQYYLCGKTKGPGPAPGPISAAIGRASALKEDPSSPEHSIEALLDLYEKASALEGGYAHDEARTFFGCIAPDRVSHQIRSREMARRKRLEGIITELLDMPELAPEKLPPRAGLEDRRAERSSEYLLLKGMLIEMDEDLREIVEDMGGIPGGVLVTGGEMGGAGYLSLSDLLREEEEGGERTAEGLRFDEWDYRRGGYRRGWCSLFERDMHPDHEPFVQMTLGRYGGYVAVLRKKFEMLRLEPRTLRRQRDGEDVDLDAHVDAFSDQMAGLSPSDSLFIKLERSERNIAVLFLIDMSGSTKGWVNEAEKESLVLMCEALEALGDRYAIYGFSGMTRNRCEYYRVKGFEEPYAGIVKSRISGITPKDYTRMGPPIRRSTAILRAIDARTKLLITLSDGKPEDYDAYKGDYAIEDTRRALLEAKEQGIHPFCITIDKEARSYLPRMYGEINYIFIDDVKKLPNRITEIYRRLTT